MLDIVLCIVESLTFQRNHVCPIHFLQLDAMMEVLNTSDEVELVLRNTGVTDDLLKSFVAALKNSLSEVTLVNLNLNHIGHPGVHALLDLLQAKLEIKGLL